MANDTYVLLAKSTVGSAGASSITFSNIPQTGYTDLLIRLSGRCSRAADQSNLVISFNNSTSNFNGLYLEGLNTTVASATFARFIGAVPAANDTANTFGSFDVYIPNYTSSNYKSYSADAVQEGNTTNSYVELVAGLWSNTAAITSISIASYSAGDNFVQYTDVYLYGISNVNATPTIAPSATGGDIITNDGTYWYHTFLSSGTFTPSKTLSCDTLVVAGGGGGAYDRGPGGGAGGLSWQSSRSATTTGYTVTIGAGGAGATSYSPRQGYSGSNSVFDTIISNGGGGAGNSQSGGSGGGGFGQVSPAQAGGTTTQSNTGGATGYGNNGGAGIADPQYPSGGGGGAGGVGGAGVTGQSGAGGVGLGGNTIAALNAMGSATSTGQLVSGNYYYAGGGGAGRCNDGTPPATYGAGGYGGGGNGGTVAGANGSAGTANTGGGGGGGSNQSQGSGGNGGSGIVIVRYAMV